MNLPKPTRPGAGAMDSKATGGPKSVRVGNTPAVNVDIDSAEDKQRHTSQGDEAITSENFPTRANAKTARETFSGDGGQFEFQGTPTESSHLQRERISKREEVKDAEIKSLKDKRFQNEKEQRDVSETLKKDIRNPRGQR